MRRAVRARCADQPVDLLRVDHQDARRVGSCATPSWSRSSPPSARTSKTGKFVQTLGSRKLWIRLRGQGHDVARCTVERIMREQGWEGARYGSKHKTTIADDSHSRYPDLVDRQFLCSGAKSLVGGRLYLCVDLDGVRLRRVRHRRVQPQDRRWVRRLRRHRIITVEQLAGCRSHGSRCVANLCERQPS